MIQYDIEKEEFLDALVINEKWLDLIFEENPDLIKDWEIRGCRTSKRGKILLIQSGSGLIVGETELVNCVELDTVDFIHNEKHHRIPAAIHNGKLPYERTYAWVIKNSKRYEKPIPYQHPRGAVIWVKIKKHDLELLDNIKCEPESNGKTTLMKAVLQQYPLCTVTQTAK